MQSQSVLSKLFYARNWLRPKQKSRVCKKRQEKKREKNRVASSVFESRFFAPSLPPSSTHPFSQSINNFACLNGFSCSCDCDKLVRQPKQWESASESATEGNRVAISRSESEKAGNAAQRQNAKQTSANEQAEAFVHRAFRCRRAPES